jgi:hypothetical protein
MYITNPINIVIFINVYVGLFLFNNVIFVFLLYDGMFVCMTTLTENFPYFFFSSKANSRVNHAKAWHGPHSSKLP